MPTIEELKYLQNQSLQRKVNITITRIIEWYQRYDGQVYVSFSGGKDSTVLLDIARRIYPDIEAVFVDTGLEYPEIREFVKTFDNVTILRPKMNFKQVIDKYGYPVISKDVSNTIQSARYNIERGTDSIRFQQLRGEFLDKNGNKSIYNKEKWQFLIEAPFKISDQCCGVMKKKPFHLYEKETGKKPIIGTMTDESRQRKTKWLQTGCNSFNNKNPSSKPMSFWTKQDVLRYLKEIKIPYCSIYGDIVYKDQLENQIAIETVRGGQLKTTGCDRTGCMFCMFGVHLEKEPNRFQRMKVTHPKLYDYCMREENGLGIGKVLDFINVKY